MTDIELLPLPQWTQYNAHLRIRANSLQRRVQDYARANMAPLIAEIERLRAEVAAVWAAMPRDARYLDPPDGGDVPLHEQVRRMAADAARAERLQEALREAQPFIGWIGNYDELHAKIDALIDHDQEVGNE